MRALVVLRTGLAFGIRLDEETAEVGNQRVDLVDLRLPPGAHRRIERIGGLQSAELDGRAEARGEIHAHAIRTQDAGERRGLFEVSRREAGGVGVHVGQHRAVDADRRAGARVVRVSRIEICRQLVPVPDRLPGIAAFDVPIEVVPVIEHANLRARLRDDVERCPAAGASGPAAGSETRRTARPRREFAAMTVTGCWSMVTLRIT